MALVSMLLIGGASRAKYAHTLESLSVDDVRFAIRQGGLSFIAETYGDLRAASIALACSAAFLLFVGLVSPDISVSLSTKATFLFLVAVLLGVDIACRGTQKLKNVFLLAPRRGHFLNFMASALFSMFAPLRKFRMLDVRDISSPLPLPSADKGFRPKFVADLPSMNQNPSFEKKRHETFYAIEAAGFDLDMQARPCCDPLDVAFLATSALKAAGVPIDLVHDVHMDLMEECGSGYFHTQSEFKRSYHRLLIDQGLVRAAV